jgi:hypothetical protein
MKIDQLLAIILMPIIESEGRHTHSQVSSRVQKKAYGFFGTLKRKKSVFFFAPL